MAARTRSGVHSLGVRWCRCHGALPQDMQLMDAGLFPASFTRIETCFTFHVLDDFAMENLECKMSCLSFYNKLRRITSSAFPFTVPDRYREFNRVVRQYESLLSLLKHGFGHTDQAPGPGQLAFFCAACPQPGVNLPDNWRDNADQYKYRRTVVLDGNMKCVLEKPKRPEDDVHLTDGEAFFTKREPYQEHLKIALHIKGQERCNNHTAYIRLPPRMAIYKGIGLFHVHGHKEDCFSKFAPNYIYGAGMVAGEIIESNWPFLNVVAHTTLFMTEAHRREVLDQHLNDMNWMKILRTREWIFP
ncbi:hypothetical protein PLICRDRAFT_55487 [Plicaturopsis crispa FD-325 SS-3]|nr:hypothetical protein PLICRDRAFT_55487 [Plicaturopsis crispa FD-325 SS-3]